MTLIIQATTAAPEVIVQQNAAIPFELGNSGTAPITIVQPGRGYTSPRLRLRDLATNAVREFAGKPGQSPLETHMSLAPRRVIKWELEVLSLADTLAPGKYEATVVYDFNDPPEPALSNPLTLTVHRHTPANLSLAGISGGPAMINYAAWVNVAATPPAIVRGRINAFKVPGNRQTDGIVIVAPCATDTRPVVSEPANQKSSDDQWIAWLAGNDLHAAFVSDQAGLAPAKKISLKLESPIIVEPLFCDPALDGTSLGVGGALLWSADRGGGKFDSVILGGKEPALDASAPCPGPKPRYMRSHTRSTGVRLCYLIQTVADAITLSYLQWPAQKTESLPLRKIHQWKGELLAARTVMDDADNIHGAIALRYEKDGKSVIEVQLWTVSPKGEFAPGPNSEIEPPPDTLIREIELALTADDVVMAQLTDDNANRYLWRDAAVMPLGGAAARPPLTQRLVFMNGADPALLTAQVDLGWSVLAPDGRPYRFPGK